MLNNIKDLLDKNIVCNRHSDFQIEKFIVGKETTPNSQAWQCLRELESRYDSLVSLEMEVANILDDIEIKKIEIEEELERNTKKSKFIVRKIERTIESLKMNHQKLLENFWIKEIHPSPRSLADSSQPKNGLQLHVQPSIKHSHSA